MKIRVRAPANVIVGTGDPVALKAGVVTVSGEAEVSAAELLISLGLAEPVEEEKHDASEP